MAASHRLGGPGFALVESASSAIARLGMLEPGEGVVVAVSGGPDSTCLLDVLARLSGSLEVALVVAHVDHGLSEESGRIAARVSREGAEAGLEVHVVKAPDLTGPNLHARARAFRYGFFEAVATRVGASKIATAHTRDDLVETTLARLIHGAGTEGLAGIPPVHGNRIRPLITVRRAETRAYCSERGLTFDDDPANEDPRFERTLVRTHVLGAISEHFGEGAVAAIARSAERAREDADALRGLAERLAPGMIRDAADEHYIPLQELIALPRALRRRVLEHAVGRVRDRSGGIEAALDALEREHKPDARFAVAEGAQLGILGDRVIITRAQPEGRSSSLEDGWATGNGPPMSEASGGRPPRRDNET